MGKTPKKKLPTESYKGVRDFYPEDLFVQKYIFGVMREVVEQYGYVEYSASILEPTELYQSKGNEEIVSEQTYTFTDRGDRSVTLRPEMTPTVARMAAQRRRDLVFPLRWYSIPNLFRYERPQRGRLREHWQLNVDLLGAPGTHADFEIIMVAYSLMRAFGATNDDFVIKINNRQLLTTIFADELGLDEQTIHKVLGVLDKRQKMSATSFDNALVELIPNSTEILTNFLNSPSLSEMLVKLPPQAKDSPGAQDLLALLALCKEHNIENVVFDPSLVRGFDYYTGTVFELFDTHKENTRSLFGGGRYDGLTSLFSDENLPAVGFGAGDVTMKDFLVVRNRLPEYSSHTDAFLCTVNTSQLTAAEHLATALREAGIRVAINLTDKNVSDQIRMADKKKIRFVICIGPQEVESSSYTIKELATSVETRLPESDIAQFLLAARES